MCRWRRFLAATSFPRIGRPAEGPAPPEGSARRTGRRGARRILDREDAQIVGGDAFLDRHDRPRAHTGRRGVGGVLTHRGDGAGDFAGIPPFHVTPELLMIVVVGLPGAAANVCRAPGPEPQAG